MIQFCSDMYFFTCYSLCYLGRNGICAFYHMGGHTICRVPLCLRNLLALMVAVSSMFLTGAILNLRSYNPQLL